MSQIPPPPAGPPSSSPFDDPTFGRSRPATVTVTVVLCYIAVVCGVLGALLAVILGIVFAVMGAQAASLGFGALGVVIAIVACAICIASAVFYFLCARRLSGGDRTWRVVYTVVTLLFAVASLTQIPHQPSTLIGTAIDVLSVVLLYVGPSRAYFDRR